MKRIARPVFTVLTALSVLAFLPSCEKKKGPAEEIGEAIDDATDSRPAEGIKDAVENAADKVENAIKN